MFYITVVLCFLENNMCKFYHVLLARYKSFKKVSKTFLKYFVKFLKAKYDGLQSPLVRKNCNITVGMHSSVTVVVE